MDVQLVPKCLFSLMITWIYLAVSESLVFRGIYYLSEIKASLYLHGWDWPLYISSLLQTLSAFSSSTILDSGQYNSNFLASLLIITEFNIFYYIFAIMKFHKHQSLPRWSSLRQSTPTHPQFPSEPFCIIHTLLFDGTKSDENYLILAVS